MHFHTQKKTTLSPQLLGSLGKRKHYVIGEDILISDSFIRRTGCGSLIFLRNTLTISLKRDSMALVGPFQLRLSCNSVNIMLLFCCEFCSREMQTGLKVAIKSGYVYHQGEDD